jgi:anti-anti-sigma factor
MIAVELTASDEVFIAGSADLTSAPALEQLEKQLRNRHNVVINVAKLEFADTTFLRFLVRLRSRAREKRRPTMVKLVGVGKHFERVLQITGLSKVFSYETA